jgi:uncharacterized caspase-like protein
MDRREFLSGIAASIASPARATSTHVAALSIGISRYQALPSLPSASRDANLIGAQFLALGFDSAILVDPDAETALRALAYWRIRAKGSKHAVLYVASHGFRDRGETHFLTSDAKVAGQSALASSVSENVALRAVSDAPRNKIFFWDCCREAPGFASKYAAPWKSGIFSPAGTFALYAAQPDAPALDGNDSISPFAAGLARSLRTREANMADVSMAVRRFVVKETQGLQIPWSRSSLLSPVVLNPRQSHQERR